MKERSLHRSITSTATAGPVGAAYSVDERNWVRTDYKLTLKLTLTFDILRNARLVRRRTLRSANGVSGVKQRSRAVEAGWCSIMGWSASQPVSFRCIRVRVNLGLEIVLIVVCLVVMVLDCVRGDPSL